ncbi:TetR-like C-terminal domain-containing protein [Streptomyces malaysiense]|uniref:TetR-like C-terminal domain-containing protein n=1 Tax=Streptomyces malaysiense TaxID=1428626 RepID=UPI001F0B219A|nr:TetR-like C-terminal domain-containing protein [Streptomyces malaysiense]
MTRRAYEKLVAELRQAWDRSVPGTPRSALRAMVHRYCAFALENQRRFRLMFGVERIAGPREDSPRHPVRLVLGVREEALAALPAGRSGQVGGERDALLL